MVQTQTAMISNLKKELRAVNQKISKLTQSNEKLLKTVSKLEKLTSEKRAKKKVSYIDWLENERRMKDLY